MTGFGRMSKRISPGSLCVFLAGSVFVFVIFAMSISFAQLEERSRETGLKTARAAVYNAALQCYALEGSYPVDLAYLADNYGLQLQEDRYVYLYQSYGGNLTPVIEVIAR